MVDYKGKCYFQRFDDLQSAKDFFDKQCNYWDYKVLKQEGQTIFDDIVIEVK